MNEILYSKFKRSMFVKDKFVDGFIFYRGDLSNADFETDWRFKEVPGKRKQVEFIELVYLNK